MNALSPINSRPTLPLCVEAARSVPLPTIAPQSFCASCEAPAWTQNGICEGRDKVIDRDQFFAFYPDAPDTDWRPWMTDAVEEAPRVIVWDFTR